MPEQYVNTKPVVKRWCYVLADVVDRLGPGGGFLQCQRVLNALGNE